MTRAALAIALALGVGVSVRPSIAGAVAVAAVALVAVAFRRQDGADVAESRRVDDHDALAALRRDLDASRAAHDALKSEWDKAKIRIPAPR